jgi:hypothetical protein
MKYLSKIICSVMLISILAGCKKDQQSSTATNGNLLKNTQWTGTFHALSQQYDAPCCLRFREDTAVTVYGLFTYVVDIATRNYQLLDSLNGKIDKIDMTTISGTTIVDITFPLTGQKQQLYITGKKDLASATDETTLPYNFFTFRLQLSPENISSVKGTTWSGAVQPNTGTHPLYDYPDLSAVIFGDTYEEFVRDGAIITYTPSDHIDQIQWSYYQKGARVYFAGYDEVHDKIYPYFGVLLPDGNKMLVDAWPVDQSVFGYGTPRLPNYINTNAPFGPNGVTPFITRQ